MTKKIIILVFTLLALGGIGYVALNDSPDAPTQQAITETNDEPAADTPSESASTPATGTYTAYSEAALSEAQGQKVLFFHASWCPQCRSIESGIEAQGVPEGYTILKVDYDTNQDLRDQYGVTLQTTFVKLDENNNELSKFVAYDEPTFEAVKRDYL